MFRNVISDFDRTPSTLFAVTGISQNAGGNRVMFKHPIKRALAGGGLGSKCDVPFLLVNQPHFGLNEGKLEVQY